MRARLPENTGGGHYDVVFALFQMLVIKLQTLEHTGRKALEDDIAPIDEAQDKIASARFLEIDCDAAFSGVQVVIRNRTFGSALPVFERSEGAQRIDTAAALDFDHVGAEIREVAAADRTDHHPAQIQNADAFQWCGHRIPISLRERIAPAVPSRKSPPPRGAG